MYLVKTSRRFQTNAIVIACIIYIPYPAIPTFLHPSGAGKEIETHVGNVRDFCANSNKRDEELLVLRLGIGPPSNKQTDVSDVDTFGSLRPKPVEPILTWRLGLDQLIETAKSHPTAVDEKQHQLRVPSVKSTGSPRLTEAAAQSTASSSEFPLAPSIIASPNSQKAFEKSSKPSGDGREVSNALHVAYDKGGPAGDKRSSTGTHDNLNEAEIPDFQKSVKRKKDIMVKGAESRDGGNAVKNKVSIPGPEDLYPEEHELQQLAFSSTKDYNLRFDFESKRHQIYFRRLHMRAYGKQIRYPKQHKYASLRGSSSEGCASNIGNFAFQTHRKDYLEPKKVAIQRLAVPVPKLARADKEMNYERRHKLFKVRCENGRHELEALGLTEASEVYFSELNNFMRQTCNQSPTNISKLVYLIQQCLPLLIDHIRALCQAFPEVLYEHKRTIKQMQIETWFSFQTFWKSAHLLWVHHLDFGVNPEEISVQQTNKIDLVHQLNRNKEYSWTFDMSLATSNRLLAIWMSENCPKLFMVSCERDSVRLSPYFVGLLNLFYGYSYLPLKNQVSPGEKRVMAWNIKI